jgi:hypothetical protein
MRILVALTIALLVSSPALAEECRFLAPDGRTMAFPEPGYMTVQIGPDTRWCQADVSEFEAIVSCPTDAGTVAESAITFLTEGAVWEGELWAVQCHEQT